MSYNRGYPHGYYPNPPLPGGYYHPQFDQFGRPIRAPETYTDYVIGHQLLGAFPPTQLNAIQPVYQNLFTSHPQTFHPQLMYLRSPHAHPSNYFQPGSLTIFTTPHLAFRTPWQPYPIPYQPYVGYIQPPNRPTGSGILEFYVREKLRECFVADQEANRVALSNPLTPSNLESRDRPSPSLLPSTLGPTQPLKGLASNNSSVSGEPDMPKEVDTKLSGGTSEEPVRDPTNRIETGAADAPIKIHPSLPEAINEPALTSGVVTSELSNSTEPYHFKPRGGTEHSSSLDEPQTLNCATAPVVSDSGGQLVQTGRSASTAEPGVSLALSPEVIGAAIEGSGGIKELLGVAQEISGSPISPKVIDIKELLAEPLEISGSPISPKVIDAPYEPHDALRSGSPPIDYCQDYRQGYCQDYCQDYCQAEHPECGVGGGSDLNPSPLLFLSSSPIDLYHDAEPCLGSSEGRNSTLDSSTLSCPGPHSELSCPGPHSEKTDASQEILSDAELPSKDDRLVVRDTNRDKDGWPANQLTLRLPFLKPIEDGDPSQPMRTSSSKSDTDANPTPSLSRASLKGLTKEELLKLKLARREADCQLNYGEGETLIPNHSVKKGREAPLLLGNYLTRNVLSRILARVRPGQDPDHPKRHPPLAKAKLDRSRMGKVNRVLKVHPGMKVYALDRWGIWCDAVVIKADHKRALVEYVDEFLHRQDWISFKHNRIKFNKASPALDVEGDSEGDSPRLDVTELSPSAVQMGGVGSKVAPGGSCSMCGLPFQQFRYFCLHCPTETKDELCSRCYFYRFPKDHKHTRLLFARVSILSSTTIMLLKRSEGTVTRFELDQLYTPQVGQGRILEGWGASLGGIRVPRATILGVHRHLPGINSHQPTLILCALCHNPKYVSSLLTGEFISLDKPFILPFTPSEWAKREDKLRLGAPRYVDLFWCHINCARFSSRVLTLPKTNRDLYGDLYGPITFYNLGRAVRMAHRNVCPRCRERGASIGCVKPGCRKYYHLRCTGKPLAFFERGQLFFCRAHETVLRKVPPYTHVIGSLGCECCGGLLPKGRASPFVNHTEGDIPKHTYPHTEGDIPNTEALASTPSAKASPDLRLSTPQRSACTKLEIQPLSLKRGVPDISQNHVYKDPMVGIKRTGMAFDPPSDSLTPDPTWSWLTCQRCIDEDGLLSGGVEHLGHPHPKESFRWTNYHDVANDPGRSVLLFDPARPWSQRPSVADKKSLMEAYCNAMLTKRKAFGEIDAKSNPPNQCSRCKPTATTLKTSYEASICKPTATTLKTSSEASICPTCSKGASNHLAKPNETPLAPKAKRAKKDSLTISINLKAIEQPSISNFKLNLDLGDPSLMNASNEPTHYPKSTIEDRWHLPHYAHEICNQLNFEGYDPNWILDSYSPTEPQWFSLLVLSSYYDIPGRAPRWASHSGMDYHGTWLPQTVRRALLRYTRPEDRVLSNFLGRECLLLRRKCIGVDINPAAVSLSKRNSSFALPEGSGIFPGHRPVIVQGDSRQLGDPILFSDASFDHVLSHPPYKDCVSYSTNIEGDLSKFANQEEFSLEMAKVIRENWRLLKMGGRVTLGIGDNRENCFYVPVSFQLLRNYLDNGFEVEEMIIKRQRQCQMFGLGTYLSAHYGFLIFTHEYIFTLKKVNKDCRPPPALRPFLRPPEEVNLWKTAVRIHRRRRAIPTYPIERSSVIMGTVWVFRPNPNYSFEKLCKSRMVERFGRDGTNWEEISLVFPKLKDEISDMKAPADPVYTPEENVAINSYEKLRERRIRENNQMLLSLGLTAELGDERSEDVTHHDRMMKLKPHPNPNLSLIILPHIPNHQLVNKAISFYRKAVREVTVDACTRLETGGFLIVGAQEYRFQDLQGSGRLVPLSLLIFEDIERYLNQSYASPPLRLKELVICVPDGYQCKRSKILTSLPVEPCILDVKPTDPFPNLPLVH
ncbi:hypothetical protein L0F63_007215, partial [Massospora cicadina]